MIHDFEKFYEDVIQEFKSAGKVVMFKVQAFMPLGSFRLKKIVENVNFFKECFGSWFQIEFPTK